MNNLSKKLILTVSKYEVYFFYTLVLLNLLPVFVTLYFPTVDGPAHLYNSRLILDLLTNDQSPLVDFYAFNNNVNPNWSGHFILSGLLYIFPAFLAEKILLLLYLIFFPISFRFLFNVINARGKFLVYFIFPFTYSFLFYYGFYNFHIGLVFYFLTIGFWIKFQNLGLNYYKIFLLFLLTLCVFFSHLFILALLLITITILNIENLISLFGNNIKKRQLSAKSLLQQIGILLPVLILSFFYFYSSPIGVAKPEYIDSDDLWNFILQVQPAKGISYGKEGIFTKWIIILLSLIISYLIIYKLKSFRKTSKTSIIWGSLTLFSFILIFIVPDGTISFGFVSSRLILFFFLFLIIFLATQEVTSWIKIIAFLIINYINIALIIVYTESSCEMNKISKNLILASKKIPPYSIVFTINDNQNWLFAHLSNYLGVDKPLIISENYEATLNYFPLKWVQNTVSNLELDCAKNQLNSSHPTKDNHKKTVDYVFILSEGHNNAIGKNEASIKPLLDSCYSVIFVSEDKSIKLYENTSRKNKRN